VRPGRLRTASGAFTILFSARKNGDHGGKTFSALELSEKMPKDLRAMLNLIFSG